MYSKFAKQKIKAMLVAKAN